jgi:hypothetical protein
MNANHTHQQLSRHGEFPDVYRIHRAGERTVCGAGPDVAARAGRWILIAATVLALPAGYAGRELEVR